MPGDPDPLYVSARSVLLDAADALVDHLDAIVLVGAQAVYLHTGEADLFDTVAQYTTDADFSINPHDLSDSPLLADLLRKGGFRSGDNPGSWISSNGVYVDLMVPEALAGSKKHRRSADLLAHGKKVARRTKVKRLAGDELSASVTTEAIDTLERLFGSTDAVGVVMAIRAAGPDGDPDFISASMSALMSDLLKSLS